MYAYITGIVAEKGHNELVIETGGIGYQLMCSMNTVQNAVSVGESMRVYTYLNVRQDGLDLFGFESREEREMFLRLTGVSGIGPRTAIAILGSMPLRDLTLAILMGDTTALCRAPGIGKKTAQRIALELKEKIMATIQSVADVELQTLLEKRYLCFLSWEKIAVEMHYSIQHIYRMHDTALSCVSTIMRANERE